MIKIDKVNATQDTIEMEVGPTDRTPLPIETLLAKCSWFQKKRLIKKLNKLRPRTFIKLDKNNVPHLVTRLDECKDVEKYIRNLSSIVEGK